MTSKEEDWLEHTKEVLTKKELSKDDNVSWAAYRASKSTLSTHQPAHVSLLPMFTESSHSPAVISASTKHLNPSQVPVLAVDQPLFAIAKEI